MSAKHEPNAQQVKDEKLYLQMGMTDEEFELATRHVRSSSELYGNGFVLCFVV